MTQALHSLGMFLFLIFMGHCTVSCLKDDYSRMHSKYRCKNIGIVKESICSDVCKAKLENGENYIVSSPVIQGDVIAACLSDYNNKMYYIDAKNPRLSGHKIIWEGQE